MTANPHNIDEEILEEIADTLHIFKERNNITEIRILNTPKKTVSGYFTDIVAAVKAIKPYIGKYNIYFTPNPPQKSLLARSANKLIQYAKQTTSDNDIEHRHWLHIDFDPKRPAGISSNDEEHQQALEKAQEVKKYLEEQGWPKPILANSGNGYHLNYKIDLPNDQEITALIKNVLLALDFLFSDGQVSVDTTTYNAARIWKMYGTISCKGDNTEDRPHRQARIIEQPSELELVTEEQLQELVQQLPKVEQPKKQKQKDKKPFQLEEWLEKHNIEVAFSAPYQNSGTKYILEHCPWNHDHTNRSAFIILFANGAMAAGCLHDSCRQHTWQSLRDSVEPGWEDEQKKEKKESGDTQADTIVELGSVAEYCCNELEEPFAVIPHETHNEVVKVNSKRFKLWLGKLFFESENKVPSTDAINKAVSTFEMKATFSDNKIKLERRVAQKGDCFYYDLVSPTWQVVEISEKDFSIVDSPTIFTRNKNMAAQVTPTLGAKAKRLIKLLKKHFRFKDESDFYLFACYLVSCFVPGIPHPILVLYGEKGASKSTSMRMVRLIVDPANMDLLTLPNSKQDLVLSLANNYMPAFDNLDSISAEKSDILCMASTGGGITKRTLYTDEDETILNFKRCVALNGINVVATRPDLLDRSIILELERINPEDRKTEKVIWKQFNADLPEIVGCCLSALSKAMAILPTVQLTELSRMADFMEWGAAICQAMGLEQEQFLDAYTSNQDRANEEAVNSHPVAAAIIALMKNQSKWKGSVSGLLTELEKIAEQEKIDYRMRSWPKASNVLSKKIKEVKSNLELCGISVVIRHAGQNKQVTIEKVGKNQKKRVCNVDDDDLNLDD